MSMFKKIDRAHYASQGYLVVENLIDVTELNGINHEIANLFAIQLRRLGLTADPGCSGDIIKRNASRLLKTDVQTYISTARLTQNLPSVHRLLISEPIIDVTRQLGIEFPVISTRPSIHFASNDLKIPNGYHKSPPHQDWRSMQGSLDSIVFWIPTTVVTESSNPMEFVPNSHLLGLLDTVPHTMTPMVSDPRITDDKYIAMPVRPGDAIFFSSFMVHRTSDQDDGHLRIAMSGRFNNALEKTYVEHGYPTPYKYSYQTDLIFPDFPRTTDLAATFPDVVLSN